MPVGYSPLVLDIRPGFDAAEDFDFFRVEEGDFFTSQSEHGVTTSTITETALGGTVSPSDHTCSDGRGTRARSSGACSQVAVLLTLALC